MLRKISLIVSISLFASAKVDAQEFHIPDDVVKATRAIYVEDSIRFMAHLNRLLSSENQRTIEDFCISLDVLRYMKLIKIHSNEIIQKLNSVNRKNSHHYNLLSLCNPPDSIRDEIFKSGCTLCMARLGDSTSIAYYINEYVAYRDQENASFSNDGIMHYIRVLLSLNSKTALDTIINDMQSSRIIKLCEKIPIPGSQDCFWKNYTYLYSIIEVLMTKHLDEPVLNRRFLHPLVKLAYQKDNLPPELPGFFKALEDFIFKEYGYSIKINVPFVLAAEPY